MKNIILILIILMSAEAFAGSTNVPHGLGQEWQLLGAISTADYSPKHTCESQLGRFKAMFFEDQFVSGRQLIASPYILTVSRNPHGSGYSDIDYISLQKVESGCSEIAFVSRYLPLKRNAFTLDVHLYCKPRPYSEMVTLSLYKTCIEKPRSECFQPEVLKKLDSAKPTQSKDIWINNCK